MLAALWFAFNVTAIQISGAYFRYLPFKSEMSGTEIEKFWRSILIWSAVSCTIIFVIFLKLGVEIAVLKIIMLLGWLPYVFISMKVIKAKTSLHVFVMGIQSLWSLMIHTVVAVMVKFFQVGVMEAVFFQNIWYIAILLLLIRWEIEGFSNILWFSRELFNSPLSKYITVMPFAIFVGCAVPIAGASDFLSLKEQLLRFLIPLFFFLMYRAIRISNRQFEELQHNSSINNILNHQLETLKLYSSLMQDNQKEVESFSLNLRRNYRQILEMLDNDKKKDALEFIKRQINLLQESNDTNKFFTSIPLLNAVFLIYSQKAAELKINVKQKIILPGKISTDEMDFAVLLANLFGQIFESVKNQPENLREVFININKFENQITLEISVSAEKSPLQDKTVAENFVEKYAANLKTYLKDDKFKIFISWQEKSTIVAPSFDFTN